MPYGRSLFRKIFSEAPQYGKLRPSRLHFCPRELRTTARARGLLFIGIHLSSLNVRTSVIVMASIAVPAAVRFTRLTIDSLHNITKNGLFRFSRPSCVLPSQKQRFSTATEEGRKGEEKKEGVEIPELSDNEKKLTAEIELLNKEVISLKEFKADLEDKYKRALADGENLRVRLNKQIEDAKLFGIQGFCKDLLEVADILGKATESVPKDELTEKNPHLKTLYEGLRMTEAQLHKVFNKHGLVSLNPLDQKFNPNEHEALFQQEVKGKEPGTIVVVSKVGYKLHERIVRPALVGVAKG